MSDEWMQSPALVILKQVDEFLFCHLPKMERLATAYKSLKLMKVRLSVRQLRVTVQRLISSSTTSTQRPLSSPKSHPGSAPVSRSPPLRTLLQSISSLGRLYETGLPRNMHLYSRRPHCRMYTVGICGLTGRLRSKMHSSTTKRVDGITQVHFLRNTMGI
jgi:hypothetical protein